MLKTYTHKKITWIDLENPTKDEVASLEEKYGIEPIVARELLSPTLRPKVELTRNNLIYLILHFPTFSHGHGEESDDQEVDFIIGNNILITTHYETINPLHTFGKLFETNELLGKADIGNHAGYLFYYLIRELYGYLEEELDSMDAALDRIEEHIFKGDEKRMVFELSKVNRDILNFKQATRPHQEVLESLEHAGVKVFGVEFAYHLRAISGEYYKIANFLESNKETLEELRDTNDSLLNTKTNEIMKILTIMAFVTFPLSLFASIFGMNTAYLPIVGLKHDFWIIIGAMVLATIFFFWFFRHNRWL